MTNFWPPPWELHKPRVWRRHRARCMATVSPSLERREWLWTVDRSNRLGRSELAHGRCPTLQDAKIVAGHVLQFLDDIERRVNERRYG